jgi:hypothetical protein
MIRINFMHVALQCRQVRGEANEGEKLERAAEVGWSR